MRVLILVLMSNLCYLWPYLSILLVVTARYLVVTARYRSLQPVPTFSVNGWRLNNRLFIVNHWLCNVEFSLVFHSLCLICILWYSNEHKSSDFYQEYFYQVFRMCLCNNFCPLTRKLRFFVIFFFLDLKIIISVLLLLRGILFALSQRTIFLILKFMIWLIFLIDLCPYTISLWLQQNDAYMHAP